MSAKLLHALTEDNPDLQKQIGCMTGIFQLFDRHHILTGRRINGQSHKRLPPGPPCINGGSTEMEPNNVCSEQRSVEKNLKENWSEKHRISTASSKASFSSCSPSFSSLDHTKTTLPEPSSSDLTIFRETFSYDAPVNQSDASLQLGRRSLNLQDVVKDSIYREARGSVKSATSKEPVGCVVKHKESPRSLKFSQSENGSCRKEINRNLKVPVDFNESLRTLAKLQEMPLYFDGARGQRRSHYEAKDGPLLQLPKDAPRFSYEGREGHRKSFDSRDVVKPTTKLKELPRLSLDSIEGSTRGSKFDTRSTSILRDFQKGAGDSDDRIRNLQQQLGTQKQCPPSVVAKLMGLEALPESISVNNNQMGLIKTCLGKDCDPFRGSSKTTDKGRQNQTFGSSKNVCPDPVLPQLQNPDLFMKPISSSRHLIERAPWRQPDRVRCSHSQKPAFRNEKALGRTENPSPSVYNEIEKSLNELKQSDKGLRALKQILDAMHVKDLLEVKKEDQASNIAFQRKDNDTNYTGSNQKPGLANLQNQPKKHPVSATVKLGHSPRTLQSPIVIMKPAKLIKKSGSPDSTMVQTGSSLGPRKLQSGESANVKKVSVQDQRAMGMTQKASLRETTSKKTSTKTSKLRQTLTMPQQSPSENHTSSGRNSASGSRRMQHKKLELEKQLSSPIHSSELSTSGRQSSSQPTKLGSPCGKLKPKTCKPKQGNNQISETNSKTRNSTHDEISMQSESNIVLDSQIDKEVTSAKSDEINCIFFHQGSQSPIKKVANFPVSVTEQEKPTARLSEDGSLAELATISSEQPSPVSVLNASFYADDIPSPVGKVSNAFEDDGIRNSDDYPVEDEWDPVDLQMSESSDCMDANLNSKMCHKKLEYIEHLIQKLIRLNLNHNEASMDDMVSLCENKNPNHRYISEILLASGLLLKDLTSSLTSFQLYSSGHPINPDLFFVLERTKLSTGLSKIEHSNENITQLELNLGKIHRKLIFDAVNEILVHKLALVVHSQEPWIHLDKLAIRCMSAKKLLKDLCSEIERLEASNSSCNLDDEDDGLKIILSDDLKPRSNNWTDFHKEVSEVALDIERSIFEDLVDEIVNCEGRQMFVK